MSVPETGKILKSLLLAPWGLEFLRVPAGRFWMGSRETERERYQDEGPGREMVLSEDYWLLRTPVTQSQFNAVMADGSENVARNGEAMLPARRVSWIAAREFCRRLNSRSAESGGPPMGWGFGLPSEAQWEYACRAGSEEAFGVGTGAGLAGIHANIDGLRPYGDVMALPARGQVTPVCAFPPNRWGFYDFHGNVWEWCADAYVADYFARVNAVDPRVEGFGSRRSLRGGGWRSSAAFCRSACRNSGEPLAREPDYGFRLALLPGPPRAPWVEPTREPTGPRVSAPPLQTPERIIASGNGARRVECQLARTETILGKNDSSLALVIPGVQWASFVGSGGEWPAREGFPLPPVIAIEGAGWLEVDLESLREQLAGAALVCLDAHLQVPDALKGATRSDWDTRPAVVRRPVESNRPLIPFLKGLLAEGWAGRCGAERITLGELSSHLAPVSGFQNALEDSEWRSRDLIPNPRHWNVPLPNGQSIPLLWAPPGRFWMGSPESEKGRYGKEGPQREVELSRGFWMAQTPVTQAQYRALLSENPSRFKETGSQGPVENVTWHDAQRFCQALQDYAEKKDLLPKGWQERWRFRLPSEAQWEYCCRAGEAGPFSFDTWNASILNAGATEEGALYSREAIPSYFKQTSDVWKYVRNRWGFYSMHGNVWEWCRDYFDSQYYQQDASPVDPEGPSEGVERSLRGGSWLNVVGHHRSAFRFGYPESQRGNDIGFRVALSPEPMLVDSGPSAGLANPSSVPEKTKAKGRGGWARLFHLRF